MGSSLKFRKWFKYGLKAQKLLAQGVWSLHAKLEFIINYSFVSSCSVGSEMWYFTASRRMMQTVRNEAVDVM